MLRSHSALLALLEQREHESYLKLLTWMTDQTPQKESNFPFALVEWMQLYNALEMLRRKLKGGSADH